MLGSVAYRSWTNAAAKHANIKMLAGGNEVCQIKAIQILKRRVDGHQFHYGYTTPQDPGAELHEALFPDGAYKEETGYDDVQMAIAATAIAADLIKTGGFYAPAAYRNLGVSAPAISDRGRGFRDPFLTAMIPRFARAAAANLVGWRHRSAMIPRFARAAAANVAANIDPVTQLA